MSRRRSFRPNFLLAAALAWLIPGAGHIYLGRVKRGIIIFVTIGATFWAGVAMGGVLTCDARYERWWFAAEMLSGAHGIAGWARQSRVYAETDRQVGSAPRSRDIRPDEHRMMVDEILAQRGVALVYPVDIVARAYAGIAGLLNLLCVFDAATLAMMGVTGEPTRKEDSDDQAEEGETS
ncbi:MAG: DUF6677 family protein [Planctomycetota bacterium]|jgi:hypothetical protein